MYANQPLVNRLWIVFARDKRPNPQSATGLCGFRLGNMRGRKKKGSAPGVWGDDGGGAFSAKQAVATANGGCVATRSLYSLSMTVP